MKKYILILLMLLVVVNINATPLLTNSATRDTTNMKAYPIDSLGQCLNLVSGDSVWLTVMFPGGAVAYADSSDWNDAQIKRLGTPNGLCSLYTWNDQMVDIDGAGVNGEYYWRIDVKDASLSLTTTWDGYKQIINSPLESLLDSAAWAQKTYDSLLVVLDSLESATDQRDDLADSLESVSTVMQSYLDTLIYAGCVWIDSSTANTNVDFGTDGTQMNPVSTFTAAKAVADSFNCKKYCIVGKGTYTIPSAHVGWVFQSINHNTIIDMNNQDIDGATFTGAHIIGTQGNGTLGIYATFFQCTLDSVDNIKADAWECALNDTVDLRTNTDTRFIKCFSNLAGNFTPVINYGAGSVDVIVRGYYGGLIISNMNSNDKLSVETDGHLMMSTTCSNAPVTLRGVTSKFDSSGTTIWTDVAALNVDHIADHNWDELKSEHIIADTYGDYLDIEVSSRSTYDVLVDSVLLANIAEIGKQFADSVMYYIITGGGFPNGSLVKFLRDIGLTVIRSNDTQGMSSGTLNHVILDVGASAVDGFYDPSVILNILTGETHLIIEYDGDTRVATLFRDMKIPFNDEDEYIIFYDKGFVVNNDGRIRAATSNTVTLNDLASSIDDTYNNLTFFTCAGTGTDEAHKIADYDGASKIATLYDAFITVPDDSSSYIIIPMGDGFELRFRDSLDANPIRVVAMDTTATGETLTTTQNTLNPALLSPKNNLIMNGDFESGLNGSFPIGWTWTYGVDSTSSGLDSTATHVASGKYAYEIGGVTDSCRLSQRDSLRLSAGFYNISYYYFESGGFMRIGVSNASGSVYDKILASKEGYYSETFYTAGGDYNFWIGSFDANDSGSFDDISLTKLSERFVIIDDTTKAGDTLALKKDSLVYQGAAGSLDSATVSNILYRVVWGIPVGSGDDSTTIDQRTVTVSDISSAELDRIDRVIAPFIGTVNDAAPTASQFVVSAAIGARGDDYYNGMYLHFLTGNLYGTYKRILDFETTNDTIYTNSFFASPSNGDSFVIAPGNYDLLTDSLFYMGLPKDWDPTDSAIFRGNVDDTLKDAHVDGDWTGSPGGSGPIPITLISRDTSGADVTVQGVQVTLTNTSTQTQVGIPQGSNASGITNWDLSAGTYRVVSILQGYIFDPDTIVITALDTIFMDGYNQTPTPPSAANVCTVEGYVTGANGLGLINAKVTITAPANVEYSRCDSTLVLQRSQYDYTDSNGYFSIPVIWSSCLDDKKHIITVEHKKYADKEHPLLVPDQVTYQVTWSE